MDAKPALAKDDADRPARRPALERAAKTASTSYKRLLSPKVLGEALSTGVMPADLEPHIGALLDEAPLSLLSSVALQINSETALPVDQVWSNMQELAAQLQITREISVSAMLKEQQARDSADVKAGRQSARSLWAFQPGDLDGYTFTPSPTSEYGKPVDGW